MTGRPSASGDEREQRPTALPPASSLSAGGGALGKCPTAGPGRAAAGPPPSKRGRPQIRGGMRRGHTSVRSACVRAVIVLVHRLSSLAAITLATAPMQDPMYNLYGSQCPVGGQASGVGVLTCWLTDAAAAAYRVLKKKIAYGRCRSSVCSCGSVREHSSSSALCMQLRQRP